MRIILSNGSTREVGQFLNPGDELVNGQKTALDAAPGIAGEQSPSGFEPSVQSPGFDESSP